MQLTQVFVSYWRAAKWKKDWPLVLAVLLLLRFAYRVVQISASFPNLFHADNLRLSAQPLGVFFLLGIAILGILQLRAKSLPKKRQPLARLSLFLQANAGGLLLAAIFFLICLTLAVVFNRADFNTNNTFFAADTNSWRLRLATPLGYQMGMRAIHPLAFLLLRPLVSAVSFAGGVDLFHGTLFVLGLVGSLDVFLVWIFIKRATNGTQAFLFASLYGVSTSALLFNSLIETYIFSGFLLLVFFVLLQSGSRMRWLAAAGVGLFGITISNLVQALVGVFMVEFKLKRALSLLVVILAVAAGLTILNQQLFPNSGTFLNADESSGEFLSFLERANEQSWTARTALVGSDMFMFSVVAPQPYLFTYNKDVRGEFPKFNFMLGDHLSRFIGLGKVAVWVWLGVLVTALVSVGGSLRREGFSLSNRMTLAFLGCLAFNFLFHLVYGFEPFLYSADWTYALIFFVALGLRPLAENQWMQAALLVLLALLTLNNLTFLYFLMNGISPFIPGV